MLDAAQGTFKVYPRGFLGAILKERVQQENRLQENNTGFTTVKFSTFKKSNGVNDFNHMVEAVYASYVKRAPETTGFDFRRKVLIAALGAFGTKAFDFWFTSQFQSPVLGDLQRRFLDDTLHFIREGRRDMSLETWNSIIAIENNDAGPQPLSEYANEFFGISSRGRIRYPQNGQLNEVIQQWVAQPNGLEDLIGTLHILFGNT